VGVFLGVIVAGLIIIPLVGGYKSGWEEGWRKDDGP
jgi:hypothetical protein